MDTETLITLNGLLRQQQLSIAVAESLSCGRLQQALGAISGSSAFFLGGVTAYTLQHKIRLLGVDAAHAREVNCVSQRVADEMAAGVGTLFRSELSLATTGYAEPSTEPAVAEPFAYIALCHSQNGNILHQAGKRINGAGLNRPQMQNHVCAQAVLILLDYLQTL
jgi:nicotinamide-nucleotide amidase